MFRKQGKNSGLLRSLGRGADTLKNLLWVSVKSVLVVSLSSLLLTIAISVAYIEYISPGTTSLILTWLKAGSMCHIQTVLSIMPIANKRPDWIMISDPNGQTWDACDLAYQIGPAIREWGADYYWQVGLIWLICTAVVVGFMVRRGRLQLADEHERGAKVIDAKKYSADYRSLLSLSGVPLPPNAETQHSLLLGAPGSGKTTLIYDLADQLRARGQRAICYDITGEFAEIFYRPGDHILNPLHARSEYWHPWCEIRHPWDGTNISNWLIPLENTTDQFWSLAAQSLLAAGLDRTEDHSVVTLLERLCTTSLKDLGKLAQGTAAAALVSEKNHKTALGVQATLAANTQSLRYLWANSEGQKPYSISRWILDESDDSWLFLSAPAAQLAALRPLLTVWLEVAATSALSLQPSLDRRLWLLIDEVPSLGKLEAIPRLLAQGRKYGVCGVLGLQSYSQLKDIYGDAGANALGGQCSTWVTLRVPDPESAEWAAKGLGEYEVTETTEGLTYGGGRDGMRLSQSRQKRLVVLPSEIQALPNLEGYLRIPGPSPVLKLIIQPKSRPAIGPAFEPVDTRRTVYAVLGGIPAHLSKELEST